MKPLRVLLITSGYPNSWNPYSGIYIKRQIDLIEEYRSVVFTILTTGDSRRGFPFSILKYFRLVSSIVVHIVRRDFDLVHAHTEFPAGVIGLLPSLISGKKFVITIHGGLMHTFDEQKMLIRRLVCLALERADHIISVSDYLKEQVSRYCGIDCPKISVIDMGVDLEIFYPSDKISARKKLGIIDQVSDRKLVLYVGNLKRIKGVIYLVQASAILRDEVGEDEFVVYIVGKGPEKSPLEDEASALGVDSVIHFIGAKPPEEIPTWMAACDYLVVPSLSEGFGLVAIEAMACGRPVIASRTGGLSEIVVDSKNGFVFEPGNPESLAQKLKFCFTHSPFYAKEQQIYSSISGHSAKVQADKVKILYTSLINCEFKLQD